MDVLVNITLAIPAVLPYLLCFFIALAWNAGLKERQKILDTGDPQLLERLDEIFPPKLGEFRRVARRAICVLAPGSVGFPIPFLEHELIGRGISYTYTNGEISIGAVAFAARPQDQAELPSYWRGWQFRLELKAPLPATETSRALFTHFDQRWFNHQFDWIRHQL